MRTGYPAGSTRTDRSGIAWRNRALTALLALATHDEGEGTAEELCQALVDLLVLAPFGYDGAAIYSGIRESWTQVARAGSISRPALPASDTDTSVWADEGDLQLLIARGHWLLVVRRGAGRLTGDERAVLDHLLQLLRTLLGQRTYVTMLTRSEQHYRHLYSHANLGIFYSRAAGGLQRANPGMLEMLGYRTERELRDRTNAMLHSFFYDPAEDRQRMLNLLMVDGQVRDFQTRLRRADGSLVPVSLSACLVQDPDAQPDEDLEFFGFLTDLSDHDRLVEARDGKIRAEASNLTKVRFLSSLSHELRTPLNGVYGMLDVLDLEDSSDVRSEAAAVIRRAADQIMNLADKISDLTSLENGSLTLLADPFSPQELVEEARAHWSGTADERGLCLEARIAAGLPASVRGDRSRCRQILDQFLDNALRYCPTGGHVSIEAEAEGDALSLGVSDDGPGLSDDALAGMLDDGSLCVGRTGDLPSVGLGLPIVKRLVDLMEGRLTIQCLAGRGNRFTVQLPLPAVEATEAAESGADVDDPRPRALVVEDNPVNQLVARKLLETLGVAVTVADGGQQALKLMARHDYAMVFMDLQMPEMDGFSATRALRSACGYQGPVVALTAHATASHREKCRQSGMNGFIAKPLQRGILARVVDQLLAARLDRGDWLWIDPAPQDEPSRSL